MPSVTDDDGGFSATPADVTGVLRVRAWGFWSAEIAAVFAETVLDAYRRGRRPTEVVLEADALKPQREDAQSAIAAMIDAVGKLGLPRLVITTSSPLTRLQLARISREGVRKGFVELRVGT